MKNAKALLIIVFIISIVSSIWGYFVLNETGEVFTPGNFDKCGKESAASSMHQLIIEGAGFFLQSNSQYQLFLKEVELSGLYGINREPVQKAVDHAVKNMELASEIYNQLVQTANNLEYNQTVLAALQHFDYHGYQELNHLNPAIFQQVERLLKAGDVRGCYQWFANAARDILEKLKEIKAVTDTGSLPGIPGLWRLNQLYMETQLFGQYTTEVFMNSN